MRVGGVGAPRAVGVCAWVVLVLASARVNAAPVGVGPLVWSDDFNGNALDQTKWQVNEPGAWGGTWNTPDAASVGNGVLKITTYTTKGPTHQNTAILGTQDTKLFAYGYFEARIQFNSSPGQWSAFWMMSPTMSSLPNDPGTAGTEIDIAEHRKVDDANTDVSSKFNTAIHWGGYGANHQQIGKLVGPEPGLSNGTWHTYGLYWTADFYKFYFDDQLVRTETNSVSHRTEYMLLSSEVEDNYWAGDIPNGGYGSQSTSTTNMLVDYVHVFDVPEPITLAPLFAIMLLARRVRHRSPLSRYTGRGSG